LSEPMVHSKTGRHDKYGILSIFYNMCSFVFHAQYVYLSTMVFPIMWVSITVPTSMQHIGRNMNTAMNMLVNDKDDCCRDCCLLFNIPEREKQIYEKKLSYFKMESHH
jgi:hypothetical protein